MVGARRVALAAVGIMVLAAAPAEGAFFTQPAGSPYAAGDVPNQIVTGDFNLDTKPDLAVANDQSSNVTILLGDGTGAFVPPGSPVTVGSHPKSVAVGDYNNDGRPDFATANFIGGNVSVFLGDGAGGFTQAANSPIAVSGGPFYVATGDFDANGLADLAIANISSTPVGVVILVGTGNGQFAAAPGSPFPSGGTFPQGLAVGDLNGDARPDIAVANHMSSTVSVLLGSGSSGTVGFLQAVGSPFPTANGAAPGNGPANIAIGDVNGDGKPDLATANENSSNASVFLGNGLGRFVHMTGSPFSTGLASLGVAVGDLNGDGLADVAAANRGAGNVTTLLSTGTSLVPGPAPAVSTPNSVVVVDLNGDGRLDLAATKFLTPGGASVLLNSATAVASPAPAALTFGSQ